MWYRTLLTITGILLFMTGCSDSSKQQIVLMSEQIDSLKKINANQQADLTNLNSFIDVLSESLDSIAQQENILFFTNKGAEKTIVDRKQLKANLDLFEQTLSNQRQRITQLTDSLRRRGANIERLNSLVSYLNHQLDEKDKLIKEMRSDLEKKNVDIAQLRNRVTKLSDDNDKLNETINRQAQALVTQNEIINEGYVMIGTKKELVNAGVISSGFLKKTKINFNSLSKDKFKTIDIRKVTEITIESAKPKILSQMPSSSYEIIKEGKDKTVLRIIDATTFWSVSNYLIIQTR